MSLRRNACLALALCTAVALAAPVCAQSRFRGADKDGDGKISLQEFLTSRGRMFERIDANHDGQITKDEVEAFKAHMEAAAAGATIRSGRDRAGGGERQVERLEELAANRSVTRIQWDAMMTKRFERLDTGHTGFITMDQLRPRRAMADAAPAAPMPPAAQPAPQR